MSRERTVSWSDDVADVGPVEVRAVVTIVGWPDADHYDRVDDLHAVCRTDDGREVELAPRDIFKDDPRRADRLEASWVARACQEARGL